MFLLTNAFSSVFSVANIFFGLKEMNFDRVFVQTVL